VHPGVLSRGQLYRYLCRSLLLAAGLLLPGPATAQPPTNLNLLQPLAEDRAKVDIVAGTRHTTVRGTLLEVSESALVLDGPHGRTEFPASDVREVWNPGGPRFRTPLIIGTAVGLGLGLITKAADGDCSDPASSCAKDGPMTAGDIAALTAVGAATGLGWAWWRREPRQLLYLGPEPPPVPAGAVTPAPALPEAAVPTPTPATTDVRPDWLSLGALQGVTVEVARRGAWNTVKGPLLAITPDTIQVLVNGTPFVIRQPDVHKVWNEPRIRWWVVPVAGLYFTLGTGTLATAVACGAVPEAEQSDCAGWAFGITAAVNVSLLSYGVAKQRRDALVYDSSRPVPARTSALTLQPLLGRHAVGVRGAFTF
jgi:hypothetical protein